MDHLIGQRFSLISKSEIRYVGTLHEINPEQSTISLEDVFSFGTEDRNTAKFIPPSQDKYDYIVFRGSDVKDIKIAEDQKENQQPSPPSVPNDPAILNASRPGPPGPLQDHRGQSSYPPQGYPHQPQFGNFPPPPHQYGRGFGPPPNGFGGPGPQYYPPPPPGYYNGPPPGQGFPPGPGQFPQQHPAPIGPPAQRGPGVPGPPMQQKHTSELPDNKASPNKQPAAAAPSPAVPAPPTTKDTSTAPAAPKTVAQPPQPSNQVAPSATTAKSQRVAPAVPFTVNQKSFVPPVIPDVTPLTANGDKSATAKSSAPQPSLEDASRQAKAAVAEAMAKLNPQSSQSKPIPTSAAIDALTQKVGETGANTLPARGRGGFRGGRGNRTVSGGQPRKIEIPQSDYDFETANAKFNKEDLVKEAIATGSPLGETADKDNLEDGSEKPQERKDSMSQSAYNKTTSFFDNISSEAREREESDGRFNGRAQRGQEFKKNIETFGQGNVDGGFRGGYRGRGRGRGYSGRGQNRGYAGGNRGRGRGGGDLVPAQAD